MNKVAIIDFEASCLPEDGESFPIEVALARVGGRSRSWLIKPLRKWRYWDWSSQAESMHGISRDMLEDEGKPAHQVLSELAEAASGLQIFADSDLDAYWLETLCQGCRAPVPFPVLHLGELFTKMETTRTDIDQAERQAKIKFPHAHVARPDAKRLALMVHLLSTH